MSLVHGRAVTAEEFERVVGREFPIQRFASLCNAILWATAKPLGFSQLAFTERVFVRDNGIDAEWVLDVPQEASESRDLIGPGTNVFQYKQRDPTSRDRGRIFAELRQNLQGAVQEITARTGRQVHRYLLFTNIDLTGDQKGQLVDAIRADYPSRVIVKILGAAELVAAQNSLPHLRSAYFATAQFATWPHAWEAHGRASLNGNMPALVGREEIVKNVKSAIEDESIGVVLISGGADIGKSRIALASTEHRPIDTVFALDAVSLGIADLLALISPGERIVIVVEDPDLDRVDELVTTALGENVKIILTIPTSRAAELVSYGRDPRVKLIDVGPLSDSESEQLLRISGAKFEYSLQSWVIEQAGGNPGILLAASSTGQQLRIEGPAFRDQVGSALEKRARVLSGDLGVEILRTLSVMTAIGYSGRAEEELETACRILRSVTPNQVINGAKPLSQGGFLRIRGDYLEVTPPILAGYLAEAAFAGRAREVAQLFRELSAYSRVRLLRRIRQLRSDAVEALWNELFVRGPFLTFGGALGDVTLLRLVAPAVPDRVAPLVLLGLQGKSLEERKLITDSVRRELVWMLDQLLFRKSSSMAALRSLSLLAEAENEKWSNNSTGVFTECFHPYHPQIPLALADRLVILEELLASAPTRDRRILVVKAIDAAFNRYGAVSLRRSEGPDPFDPPPIITYEQLHSYSRSLIRFARSLTHVDDQQVASAAGEALMSAIATFAMTALPREGVQMLQEILPNVLDGTSPIKVASFVHSVRLTADALKGQGDRFREEADRAEQLLIAVEQGSYEIQVKRWVGSWDYGDQQVDERGHTEFRSDREIRRLAQNAAERPEVLDQRSLQWLLSDGARRAYDLFYFLGKYDTQARWQARIEDIGRLENGRIAFGWYFGGRAAVDAPPIDSRLDELTASGQVRGDAIVVATHFIPGNQNGISRMTRLLAEGRVTPDIIEKQLMSGGWMKTLSGDEAFRLLSAIAGPELRRGDLVIDFLAMWVHSQKPIEGDLRGLAWRSFETAPQRGESWDYDLVAGALAAGDWDRAFGLLERLLTLPPDYKSWEPLDRHGGARFWSALWSADRARCLRLIFAAAMRSPLIKWKLSWHLPDLLDCESNKDLLIDFGRQNVDCATFITSTITAARPGFWAVAVPILSSFPEAASVRGNIAAAAEHMNRVIVGPASVHSDKCAQEVEEAIEREKATGSARDFLIQLAQSLRERARAERRQEVEEEVNL